MTTTLRPTEPLQRAADGTLSRHYQVCVNSRPVGAIHLGTSASLGDSVARIVDLRIDGPDRGRGRATVAALAAEEVARGWGCTRIGTVVPGDAEPALRLARALGYVVTNRGMRKSLGAVPPALPPGSRARPMTPEEFGAWQEYESEHYARTWTERGLPEEAAREKARRDHERMLPRGLGTDGMRFSVLEHEGTRVGHLWLALDLRDGEGFVFDVETDAAHRGRGHGRTLMLLAERQTVDAGLRFLGLNVFAGNTPAERLYDSLGYETTQYSLLKHLV